jgi:hypothetical protein
VFFIGSLRPTESSSTRFGVGVITSDNHRIESSGTGRRRNHCGGDIPADQPIDGFLVSDGYGQARNITGAWARFFSRRPVLVPAKSLAARAATTHGTGSTGQRTASRRVPQRRQPAGIQAG